MCLLVQGSCAVLSWRDGKVWSKLGIVVSQSDLVAETMLVELLRCESVGLLQVAVSDWTAIFADKLAHRVVCVDATTDKLSICCLRKTHSTKHWLAIFLYLLNMLTV